MRESATVTVAAQQCGGSHPTIRQLPHNNVSVGAKDNVLRVSFLFSVDLHH